MKKIIYFIFCILSLVSLVNAEPPFETEQFEVISEGLEIEYPIIRIIKQSQTTTFRFHVYNATSGFPMDNTTLTCFFHLLNMSGNHIYDREVIEFDHPFDFEIHLNGNNFTDVGEYSYVFQCNDSSIGGFTGENFRVTTDGEDESTTDITAIMIVIIFFALLFITLGFILFLRREK